ncbi:metal ABC transporter ATP-binding protein [Lipingzhangella sp. LS1_29]|uniref:Metal ABC transporter ATP-binding protein n=1 Tax=Lipingzhangella rawalii TaxID=2055835 RepID=A0ABU2H1L4_9ACTN|nr:metal ABC transporter ATP-binding protein [Lipingzhangella rawalii]MDS1269189.1 metal ABC transporter ATP-binding protein [Lipingzhangella rawalii]
MTTVPPAVAADRVTVRYGEVQALTEVSLTVGPGRICGLIGANGSGKSSFFGALTGLVPLSSGTVALHGQPPSRARSQGLVAYVPQAERVDWSFPVRVRDMVMMGRYAHMGITRRPRTGDHAAVDNGLDRLGLRELAHRQIGELSGGQRKRAFVARAIAQGAAVLLLDEPFAGVDARSQHTLTMVLRDLAATGHTVVVSTHDLGNLTTLCDEVALLHQCLLAHGPPQTVLTSEHLAGIFTVPTAPLGAQP